VFAGLLAGWADFDDDLTMVGELLAEALAVAKVAADDLEIAVGLVHDVS
jgi:hypothetical protein